MLLDSRDAKLVVQRDMTELIAAPRRAVINGDQVEHARIDSGLSTAHCKFDAFYQWEEPFWDPSVVVSLQSRCWKCLPVA